MDKDELNKIADAWVAGEEAEEGTSERENNWWAIERVMDWALDRKSEILWQFVLAVYGRNVSDKVLAVLAAGPLEDLLAFDGATYIERVEELSRKDAKFNWLLGGVWRNSMTDDVWKRVKAARKEVW